MKCMSSDVGNCSEFIGVNGIKIGQSVTKMDCIGKIRMQKRLDYFEIYDSELWHVYCYMKGNIVDLLVQSAQKSNERIERYTKSDE
jgi:hypothetical protein